MKIPLAIAAGALAASTMATAAGARDFVTTTVGDTTPFARMLQLMPEDAAVLGGSMTIQYTDIEALWRRAGVDGDADDRLAAFHDIAWIDTFPQPPIMFGNRLPEQDPLSEVGFAFQHILQEIAVVDPPSNIVVVATNASSSDVVGALESDPVWSADLTTIGTESSPYFAWGEDGASVDAARISTFRPLGQPGFLAVLGDQSATVVHTNQTEPMERALATANGAAPSLMESWLFEPVVAAVAGREVLYAMAFPAPTLPDPAAVIAADGSLAPELLDAATLLLPYLGIVIVGSTDGGGEVQVDIFAVHADDHAADNVASAEAWLESESQRTGTPFSELLPGAQVSADGSLLRITASGQDTYRRAVAMAYTRELLPTGGTS
jgi:hypothetical protein